MAFAVNWHRIPGTIDRRALKVGVQLRDVADGNRPCDAAPKLCFCGNHSGQHLANRIATDQCLARPRHEASFRVVQSDHRIKIAGVETLLE